MKWEAGHLLAAQPPAWAKGLGPVPADPERAQLWRDTAVEIQMFRERYKVPAAEETPIPAKFREQETGALLHERIVSLARGHAAAPSRG